MLNNPFSNNQDILERLRNPQAREKEKRQKTKNLFLRNILNSIFILVALVAMIGILVDSKHTMIWYSVGLFAVIIKIVEVLLRMPGLKR